MTTFQILEQFCEIVQGGRHKLSGNDFVKSGYPAYGAGGMNGYLATFEFDESAVILSSIGARCGKCFYVEGRWSSLANTQVIFPDKNECDAKFLWYQLNDEKRWPRAGTGQPFIKPSDVKRHKVFLPPIEEQRRIAAILDQAETLRTQRRTALALLDSLTQSLFLDMFGDPVANPKGWQRLPLSALVEKIDSGWSPVCLDRRAEEGEWAVLKLGALTSCEFTPQENKALPPDIAPVESIEVKPGDLLFSRKNTYELVAACALVNQTPARLMMSDLIFRFRLNASSAVIPQYLHRLLTYATKRQEVQKLAGGSAGSMPNISKAKLLDFLIEVPPLPLQKTFATRIASIEALKTTHRHALAALDALFASLQQRAFTGAL